MKYIVNHPPLIFFIILSASLLGVLMVGIHRAAARSDIGQLSMSYAYSQAPPSTSYVVSNPLNLQQTPVSFPTLTPTSEININIESLLTPTPFSLSFTQGVELQAFIHAPTGILQQPYVILTAFDSDPASTIEIRGVENLREFICADLPCAVPLNGDSTIRFFAINSEGLKSSEVQARVRVDVRDGGFYVVVQSVNQFTLYNDTCGDIWGVYDEGELSWPEFPPSPFFLNTDKTLHLLAARLITSGAVDASSCSYGGLGAGGNYVNGCGIERTSAKVVEWQNQFDFKIWTTSLDVGIPPQVLKTLIEYESQFWPSNQRFYLDEIGLGQINQLGVDVLLRQDPEFYNQICPTIYSDCSLPYTSLDPVDQTIVRGAIIQSINAECPSCEYGIDLAKASQSITVIGHLLKTECEMVDYLNLAGRSDVDYSDLWRYTMATYHSGFTCVRDAVREARAAGDSLDWDTVSNYFGCPDAKLYVDGYWDTLLSFDAYRLASNSSALLQAVPTFLPTPTPIPQPTAIPSTAKILVRVYMDANRNSQPEEMEFLDGITVDMLIRGGTHLSGITSRGEFLFDMAGYPSGTDIIVSLPGLYRDQLLTLPKEGIIQVDFVFNAPSTPNQLP